VEEYRTIGSFESLDDFLKYCAPYSVFSDDELKDFWRNRKYPHLIRFTYNIALNKRITRQALIEDYHLDGSIRWEFLPLTHDQFVNIAQKGLVDENLIVH
jgi:hypothetical protein